MPIRQITAASKTKPCKHGYRCDDLRCAYEHPLVVSVITPAKRENAWAVPVRWFWLLNENGYNLLVAFDPESSDAIEGQFCKYRAFVKVHPPPAAVPADTSQFTYKARGFTYVIDFERQTQTNTDTKTVRSLMRGASDRRIRAAPAPAPGAPPHGAAWFHDLPGKWHKFSNSEKMEEAYVAYACGEGDSTVTLQPDNHQFSYDVDFFSGTQVNKTTKTLRQLVRTPSDAHPCTIALPYAPANGITVKYLPRIAKSIMGHLRSFVASARLESMSVPDVCVDTVTGRLLICFPTNPAPFSQALSAHLLVNITDVSAPHAPPIPAAPAVPENPRLARLKNPVCEVALSAGMSRLQFLEWLAHHLLWDKGISIHSIYGGFVRDWVVRGEDATDIDCLLQDAQSSAADILRFQQRLYGLCVPAGISVSPPKDKGAARAIRLIMSQIWQIDVDFVRSDIPKMNPGVDSSAGNLCVLRKPTGVSIELKVASVGTAVSLEESIEHCKAKKFVFFYTASYHTDPASAGLRAIKYLDRGWTCISPLPPGLNLSPTQRSLYMIDPKYANLKV